MAGLSERDLKVVEGVVEVFGSEATGLMMAALHVGWKNPEWLQYWGKALDQGDADETYPLMEEMFLRRLPAGEASL